MIRAFNFDTNSEDQMQRMARMIGKITYKLSKFGLHLKYQEPILNFFKATTESADPEVQKAALFNLPCFHLLYKDAVKPLSLDDNLLSDQPEPAVDINFHALYQKFAEDESIEIREVVAACIHEPFIIRTDTEDISILQTVACELMESNERKVA